MRRPKLQPRLRRLRLLTKLLLQMRPRKPPMKPLKLCRAKHFLRIPPLLLQQQLLMPRLLLPLQMRRLRKLLLMKLQMRRLN